MPFDITQTYDIRTLTAEIDELAEDGRVRQRFDAFSRWRIYPGQNGKVYQLRSANCPHRPDDEGYYLTNLVLQGGGTLGLAHAGFIFGLERAGFRFPAIAGTSAGAIVAAGLFAARGNNILAETGPTLVDLVGDVPMDTFVDGPRTIRRIVRRFAAKRSIKHPMYIPGLFATFRQLLRKRGINSGLAFEMWMSKTLTELGLSKTNHFTTRMKTIAHDLAAADCPDGLNPFSSNLDPDTMLKLISTAMPTGMKFALPRDLRLLHPEYADVSPARMVRMSMSIPLFFEPCVLRTNPSEWRNQIIKEYAPFVTNQTAWEMAELDALTFLDGGLFSNLPTDELTAEMSDDIGCISAPLVRDPESVQIINARSLRGLVSDAFAVFEAIRLQRDRDAHSRIIRDAKANRGILKIDTGPANWLNFAMDNTQKEDLFLRGLQRVRDYMLMGV
ncbi:patatin-like phospholipase family protein [Octadecabacter sp.]|nr:patatin-like phospholipase family protein [Octadecabacter sp.]